MKQQHVKAYPLTLALKTLRLENFRLFEELELDLHPNLTVLIGVNGSGKTTILDALSKFLNYALSAAFGREKVGEALADLNDIRTGTDFYRNKITAEMQFYVYDKVGEDKEGNDLMDWVPFSLPPNPKPLLSASVELRKVAREEDRFNEDGEESARQFGDSFEALYTDRQPVIPPVVLYVRTEASGATESSNYALLNSDFQLSIYQDALNFAPGSFALFERWFKTRENRERQQRTINKNLDAVRKAIYLAVNDNGDSNHADYANMVFADYTDEHLGEAAYDGIIKVNKNGVLVPLAHLSSGEKRLALLVANIAFRMVVANKGILDNPFETNGVVLIDELDAHLHPRWQQKAVGMLRGLFPNVQFVVTTHSPLLLTHLDGNCKVLRLNNQKIEEIHHFQGLRLEQAFYDLYGAEARPAKVKKELNKMFSYIEAEKWEKAQELFANLKKILPDNDPAIQEAESSIQLAGI